MNFHEYVEIENTYQGKYLANMLEFDPTLQREKYVLTEKLDGGNISFIFNPDQQYQIARRQDILKENVGRRPSRPA